MPPLPFKDKGPCEVIWDPDGANMALAPFLGTVSLKLVDSISEIQEEGMGETAVDAIFSGTKCSLDVPMARSTLEQLISLLQGVESTGAGAAAFKVNIGCDLLANAKKVVIKPVCNNVASVDPDEWITIHKAYPYREFDLGFDRENQRIHMVHFFCFPDAHQEFYRVGV